MCAVQVAELPLPVKKNKKKGYGVSIYLGTTVTRENLIEEEIKERIAAGNRASFSNQKILQSKLISKKTKMKLYKALIRPADGSECWVLAENIKQKLLVFEWKILRRIFGPTQKANGEWRLETNEELEKAINNENIVKIHKIQTTELVEACRKND